MVNLSLNYSNFDCTQTKCLSLSTSRRLPHCIRNRYVKKIKDKCLLYVSRIAIPFQVLILHLNLETHSDFFKSLGRAFQV